MRCCSIETRDRIIVKKIIDYCGRIADNLARYSNDFKSFQADYLFQDACCMCVVQIGELAGQLTEETRQQSPGIPWRVIKDTRNFYVHAYGSIDVPSVWQTLTEDIPVLKKQCEDLLKRC